MQENNYYYLKEEGASAKKGDNTLFNVTMGSFDTAEICQLADLYLLDKPSRLIKRENVGL